VVKRTSRVRGVSRWAWVPAALLFAAPVAPWAKTVHVDVVNGQTGNDGLAPDQAVPSLGEGIALLEPGDEMVVAPGVYYERPEFYVPGTTAETPVWVRAQPLGSATISGMWEEAARGEVEWQPTPWEGIYTAEHGMSLFGAHDGTFLFRFNDVDDLRAGEVTFAAQIHDDQVITLDLPDHGFSTDGTSVYLRLPGGIDPNGESVLLSLAGQAESEDYTLAWISSTPHLIVDGFRIQGSGTHGLWYNRNSHTPTIRNTVFEYCVYGARLPDDAVVEWSEYTYPGFKDFADLLAAANPDHAADGIFHLVKEYQSYEHAGPALLEGGLADAHWQVQPSVGGDFHHNWLHEAFDGEQLGHFDSSRSHHSVYTHNYDNHMELETYAPAFGSRDLHVHDNLMLACPLGAMSHQEDSIVGPHYVYRNVIHGYDDAGMGAWTQIKSLAPNAVEGMVYVNNTIWAGDGSLFWDSREHLIFRNNIFVFEALEDVEDPDNPLDSDHNLLVNAVDEPWLRGLDHGIYLGADPDDVGFLDPAQLDFGLAAGSPAIDAGELFPGITDDVADGAPDLGAFELDSPPGPDWPRPRATTFTCDPPARWPGQVPEDYCGDDDDTGDDDSADDDDSAGDDDTGDDDTGDDDTTGDDDGGDEEPGDCRCATGSRGHTGAALLLLVGAVRALRRVRSGRPPA